MLYIIYTIIKSYISQHFFIKTILNTKKSLFRGEHLKMNTIGIITEYNPFHKGHAYQMEQAKKTFQADNIVVVMSGNFVQRGTPAIVDKYTRTRIALAAGADFVFELPVMYATSSAESFAFAGISILNRLGFIDGVSYGCETPSIDNIKEIAFLLCTEPSAFKQELQAALKKGFPYPVARKQALLSYYSKKENFSTKKAVTEALLSNPNNILAIEYQKALFQLQSNLIPIPILRKGSNHHSDKISTNFPSASALRKEILTATAFPHITEYLVQETVPILQAQYKKTFPITENDFSSLLYYKLAQEVDYTAYLDVSETLSNKIKKQLSYSKNFQTLAMDIKSKELVYTRICRSLLHILVNITKEGFVETPPYVRLLGFRKSKSSLLHKTSDIPIITKVANAKKIIPDSAFSLFEKDLFATHLYNQICYEKYGTIQKTEYEQGPIID